MTTLPVAICGGQVPSYLLIYAAHEFVGEGLPEERLVAGYLHFLSLGPYIELLHPGLLLTAVCRIGVCAEVGIELTFDAFGRLGGSPECHYRAEENVNK